MAGDAGSPARAHKKEFERVFHHQPIDSGGEQKASTYCCLLDLPLPGLSRTWLLGAFRASAPERACNPSFRLLFECACLAVELKAPVFAEPSTLR